MNLNIQYFNKPIKERSLYEWLFWLGISLISCGLPWSNYLTSASIMFLSTWIVFRIANPPHFLFINQEFFAYFRIIKNDPYLLSFVVIFIIDVVSIFWSSRFNDWMKFTRIQLPFLLIPLFLVAYPKLSAKQWRHSMNLGMIVLFGFCIKLVLQYLQHPEFYQLEILQGRAIPTPVHHIRFTLLIACSCLLIIDYLYRTQKEYLFIEKIIHFVLLIGFVISLHIFSVKSGLIALYLGVLVYFFIEFRKRKKLHYIGIPIIIILLMLSVSFFWIPAFQNKVWYLLWQYGEWRRGNWIQYSDLERLVTMQIGWEVIKDNLIMGTGLGDLKQEMIETYLRCYNQSEYKFPHNQFLFAWAAFGLIGLGSTINLMFQTFLHRRNRSNSVVMSLQSILWFSCMVESTFQSQIGVCMFVFYSMYCYSQLYLLKDEISSISG
ncbi:MAG TPA: O-antigen ligase family protein [Saprospiraceae bacterium]|nr:O-antigen ligase family protein [Saprospiraceae bacterium]